MGLLKRASQTQYGSRATFENRINYGNVHHISNLLQFTPLECFRTISLTIEASYACPGDWQSCVDSSESQSTPMYSVLVISYPSCHTTLALVGTVSGCTCTIYSNILQGLCMSPSIWPWDFLMFLFGILHDSYAIISSFSHIHSRNAISASHQRAASFIPAICLSNTACRWVLLPCVFPMMHPQNHLECPIGHCIMLQPRATGW